MKIPSKSLLVALVLSALQAAAAVAAGAAGTPAPGGAAPEHFSNPPANLNKDPGYVPGAYPFPDINKARSVHHLARTAMVQKAMESGAEVLYTLGIGEVTFTAMKNKDTPVLGYFRDYSGVAILQDGLPKSVLLLVDVNSMDAGVPARNNRVLAVFFESMNAKLGSATLELDGFDLGGKTRQQLEDGQPHPIGATGRFTLNEVTRDLAAKLTLRREKGTWHVETMEPIELLISDYGFGDRPLALMKECNHAFLGNKILVKAHVALR